MGIWRQSATSEPVLRSSQVTKDLFEEYARKRIERAAAKGKTICESTIKSERSASSGWLTMGTTAKPCRHVTLC